MELQKLVESDPAILAVAVHDIQSGLKILEELIQNLGLGAFVVEDVGMSFSVEQLPDVVRVNTAILLDGSERLLHNTHSVWGHLTPQRVHKFAD